MSDLIERLQKMSVCVYLATEEAVAADISDGLKKAIERIAELEASVLKITADCNAVVCGKSDRITELEAEVARLRVDGERLDWCEQAMKVGHPSVPYWDDLGFFCYPYLVNGSPRGGGVGTVNCGQSLRAAIDAAKESA